LAGSRIRRPRNKRKTDTDGKREEKETGFGLIEWNLGFFQDFFCR
jgi:hypothetical protein